MMATSVLRNRWWIAIKLFEMRFAQRDEAEPAERCGRLDGQVVHETFVTVHFEKTSREFSTLACRDRVNHLHGCPRRVASFLPVAAVWRGTTRTRRAHNLHTLTALLARRGAIDPK